MDDATGEIIVETRSDAASARPSAAGDCCLPTGRAGAVSGTLPIRQVGEHLVMYWLASVRSQTRMFLYERSSCVPAELPSIRSRPWGTPFPDLAENFKTSLLCRFNFLIRSN